MQGGIFYLAMISYTIVEIEISVTNRFQLSFSTAYNSTFLNGLKIRRVVFLFDNAFGRKAKK